MSVQGHDLDRDDASKAVDEPPPSAAPPDDTAEAVPQLTAEDAFEAAETPPLPAPIGELIFSILLVILGVAIVVIGELTIKNGAASGDLLGPRAFPRIAGALLALCAGAATIASVRARLGGRPVNVAGAAEDEPGIPSSAVTAFTVIGLTLTYAATLNFLGYLLATPIYLIATLWVLKVRRWKPLLIVGVGMPILLYYVFAQVLGVLLPSGLLRPILVPIGWAL